VFSRIVAAGFGFALAAVCALSGAQPAAARRAIPPPIFVGGQLVRARSLFEHGHLLVPVRGIFEALHADVEYTPPRIVVVRRNGTVVAGLEIGRRHAVVYNRPRTLSVAPIRRGGRVYVPLRAVAEIAGATVTYSRNPRLVDIRIPNNELVVASRVPDIPAVPSDNAPPPWALGAVVAVVLAFALECWRRILILRRARQERRVALRSGVFAAARQLAYTSGLRDKHGVGDVGKQPGVDDAVNSA
jgi:hypothetical protein